MFGNYKTLVALKLTAVVFITAVPAVTVAITSVRRMHTFTRCTPESVRRTCCADTNILHRYRLAMLKI